ncbi:MAG TPA: LysR family transcriptional regulator [Candidatus Acidoferrales bacterium]|jgi:DNA-binding transcriptional LysR family regulator|nr:LysR family transcriptional regulator [Candidatus Acidoferrales bacterium]
MDLNELQVFLTVAREKSFSRAAEKLFRTQPAVSMSVRKLEEWAGEPLFVRGSRAGRLTGAGEVLLEHAERMLNLREDARRGIDDLRGLRRGRLSLGVNESSIHALLPFLAQFRKLHPEIKITVLRTSSREIPNLLLNYKLDLGVVSYVPRDAKLAATPFFNDKLTLVVHPGHRLARRKSVDISELGGEIFIAHIVDSQHRWKVIHLFERHHVPLNREVELPTIESIKRFVEMGMGVAIVPSMCVRHEVLRGDLVSLSIKQLNIPRRLYFVYRRDEKLNHTAQALLSILRACEKTSDSES